MKGKNSGDVDYHTYASPVTVRKDDPTLQGWESKVCGRGLVSVCVGVTKELNTEGVKP